MANLINLNFLKNNWKFFLKPFAPHRVEPRLPGFSPAAVEEFELASPGGAPPNGSAALSPLRALRDDGVVRSSARRRSALGASPISTRRSAMSMLSSTVVSH